MNLIQQDYIQAKANLQVRQERALEALRPFFDMAKGSDADLERYCEIDQRFEGQLGLPSARKNFLEARVNLFCWARRTLEAYREAHPDTWRTSDYETVMALFDRELSVIWIDKLADICMKLDGGNYETQIDREEDAIPIE